MTSRLILRCMFLAALGTLLDSSFAQDDLPRVAAHFDGDRFACKPVLGAPYVAEEVRTDSPIYRDDQGKVLGRISSSNKIIVARDSHGRIYRRSSIDPHPTSVEDLASGTRIEWDDDNEVATMSPVPKTYCGAEMEASAHAVTIGEGPGAIIEVDPEWLATKEAPRFEEARSEILGQRKVEGITASGFRLIKTYADSSHPPGKRTVTMERWYSPELVVDLLYSRVDSVYSMESLELKKIRRGEPDPKLFDIPEGYSVQKTPNEWGDTLK